MQVLVGFESDRDLYHLKGSSILVVIDIDRATDFQSVGQQFKSALGHFYLLVHCVNYLNYKFLVSIFRFYYWNMTWHLTWIPYDFLF